MSNWARHSRSQLRRRTSGSRRLAVSIEEMEPRCLLTFLLVEAPERYVDPLEFGNDLETASDLLTQSANYVLEGYIGRGDVDFLRVEFEPGGSIELDVEPVEYEWEIDPLSIGIGSGTTIGISTSASYGGQYLEEDVGDVVNHASSGILSASGNASIAYGAAYATAAASYAITPVLPAGTLTWHNSLVAHGASDEFQFLTAAAVTVTDAQTVFASNRSGIFQFSDSSSLVTGHFEILGGNGRAVLNFNSGYPPNWHYLSANPGQHRELDEGLEVSWTYQPDADIPTAGIFDADGTLLASREDHLSFTSEAGGVYYLAIAHDHAFEGPDDEARDYWRPYHVELDYLKAPIHFDVMASYDTNFGTEKTLGPYLSGIELSNTLQIRVQDPLERIDSLEWSIPGVAEWTPADKLVTTDFEFTLDMGTLPRGDQELLFRALDAAGDEVATDSRILAVSTTWDFQLSSESAHIPAGTSSQFRFVAGIPLSLKVEGVIHGVAGYYQDLVEILASDGTSPSLTILSSFNSPAVQFEFTEDPSDLPVGWTSIDALVGDYSAVEDYGDQPEKVLVVAFPQWLRSSAASFSVATGSYEFKHAAFALPAIRPDLVKTGIKWMDKLLKGVDTSLQLKALLNVTAPVSLVAEGPVRVNGSQLRIDAQVLGKVIDSQIFQGEDLTSTGQIDLLSLLPQHFGLRLAAPRQLEQLKLFDKEFSINIVSKIYPVIPSWLAKATLGIQLKLLADLQLNAGVQWNQQGTAVVYEPSGTFINLIAAASATIAGRFEVKILKGWVLGALGEVSGNFILSIQGGATFSGTTATPQVAQVTLQGNFRFFYRVLAQVRVLSAAEFTLYDSAADGVEDETLVANELFHFARPGRARQVDPQK